MKTSVKCLCILALSFTSVANAQFFKRLKKKVDKKLKQTEEKFEKKVDKGIDDLLFSTDSTATDSTVSYPEVMANSNEFPDQNEMDNGSSKSFESYSNFDFIPGTDIKSMENFESNSLGDFPATWNTNSSAEVVELSTQSGKWLQIGNGKKTLVFNDIVDHWEEDFTLEFDIAHDFPQESAFKRHFDIIISDLKDANSYLSNAYEGKAFTYLRLGAAGGSGYGAIITKKATIKSLNATSKTSYDAFHLESVVDKVHHISIVKKGLRLKMYINGDKVVDMIRAFDPAVTYSTLRFGTNISPTDQHFYLSNIKYAVNVELPESLFENGSFQTNAITFETNSSNVKPESAGVLKKLALEMQNSSSVYEITGHTDSDGDAARNQLLSEQRAQAVKEILVQHYGIETSRLTTNGKGETAPLSYGEDRVAKAQNRRVEIKQL